MRKPWSVRWLVPAATWLMVAMLAAGWWRSAHLSQRLAAQLVSEQQHDAALAAQIESQQKAAAADHQTAATKTPTEVAKDPLTGTLVSGFGWRWSSDLDEWSFHGADDLAAPSGTPVVAVLGGTVTAVTHDLLWATTVVVADVRGTSEEYADLSRAVVAVGQKVRQDQIIGYLGTPGAAEASSGPHLHLVWLVDGQPRDPAQLLPH